MRRSKVIAITPDPALGRILCAAMTTAGAEVRDVASAAELGSGPVGVDLILFHWVRGGDPSATDEYGDLDLALLGDLADRLPASSHILVLLPRGDLAASVAAMQAHQRVAGVMVADGLRVADLTAMTTRLLHGNIFGLDRVLPWGARVNSLLVGDRAEKAEAVRQVSAFAAAVGLRRMHRERIERCCDEMIMNALYDAPVDEFGKPRYAHDRKAEIALDAADAAAQEGIGSLEVIDLRSIVPLDEDTLVTSAEKTGHVVVVHEAGEFLGVGAEIAARVSERAFLSLEAPVRRVSGYDTPIPMPQMEDDYIPDVRRTLAAIHATVRY
jgi:hypothetical protein